MDTDAQWNLDLLDALGFEAQFSAAQVTHSSPQDKKFVQPTHVESARAVANIRAWRGYLPESCVSTMIGDGWQWST
ncbi:MAG: hypothetical protein ABJC66_05395 [Gammaproteobacteria bacterium]